MVAACIRTTYRGVTICKHSLPKYQKLAAVIGSGIYLRPIQGSYSTSVNASAGTHAGGGAMDIELDGHTFTTARMVETKARDECDLLMWVRWWSGNHHGHILDPQCPNLSSTAAAQFVLFGKGYDGLIGNTADTGSRLNANRLMILFNARFIGTATNPAPVTVTPKPVNYNYPYTYKAGWYPFPGRRGASYYGPSRAGTAWYSGKVAGGTNAGLFASGSLTLRWIRGHIQRIQRIVGVTPDAIYGPVTVTAVKRWQARRGLTVDGICGPRTWAAMAKSRGQ